MDNPENVSAMRRVLRESELPAAPMAMPEQVLARPRVIRVMLLRPLLDWLTPR
jgi:hypothetical protein